MNAVIQKSPLDPAVQQVLDAPAYFTLPQATKLIDLCKMKFPALFEIEKKAANTAPKDMISTAMQSLQDTIEKMGRVGMIGADGTVDTAALKRIVDSNEKLIKLLARLGDQISASERQEALENAIGESLDKLGNQALKDEFLALLHDKLAEKSQKMRENA